MAQAVLERVALDRTSPTRAFANLIVWDLLEDGTKISNVLTRAVLTLTPVGGGSTLTYDSTDYSGFGAGNMFAYSSGTLSIDLSAATGLTAGLYYASLDVYDTSWYAWSRGQSIQFLAEA